MTEACFTEKQKFAQTSTFLDSMTDSRYGQNVGVKNRKNMEKSKNMEIGLLLYLEL